MNTTLQTALDALPHTPGVYIYRNEEGVVIYVGKAIDLARRVRSYFSTDDQNDKTRALVQSIDSLETIDTASEFDALLLEAKLIQSYKPKYNIIAKDDKSPLYVYISLSEPLPRIRFVRKREFETVFASHPKDVVFGPFQSSKAAKSLLRSIRRIVPYCTQKERNGKACFYTHLGLCSPCPSVIAKMPEGDEKRELTREYKKHMNQLREILSGGSIAVMKRFENEMSKRAQDQEFEKAAEIKKQRDALYALLTHRFDPSLYLEKTTLADDVRHEELESLQKIVLPYFPHISLPKRIECVDISHLSGQDAVGSLVVLTDGIVDTSQYRRFKIQNSHATDDTARMAEVISRRFRHHEWAFPDLLVVDGGKGQISAALDALHVLGLEIPVIGLAKREEEIIVYTKGAFATLRLPFSNPAIQIVQRLRDEAHRYAKKYQILLRGKRFSLNVGRFVDH